jgi:hypothetical protein
VHVTLASPVEGNWECHASLEIRNGEPVDSQIS